MIQIAIFSDIHGNLPALKAVLADIDARKIKNIFCLGDLVDFAPWSNEVIEAILAKKIPCIMGNHDERIAFDYPIIPLAKHDDQETTCRIQAINHSKKIITAKNKLFLTQLPYSMQFEYKVKTKNWRIQLVHGSLESNEHYLYETTSDTTFEQIFNQTHADILVMGHTHISYIKSIANKWAINTGSVGRSKEESTDATYLLLKLFEDRIEAEIIRIPYDIITVIDAIKASEIPNFYADFLLSKQIKDIAPQPFTHEQAQISQS
ncbi:metallophosphoesterase [Sphingobacterium faecium]|uniref:metallophosphoesterase family protein n=1 Tax=Sphingobacterium faecium TaxID=34087 RepID=UPI001291E827|nr:metallophosphoesterase family protein [Sphingobacterium faecium]MQP29336.1 metallophosphoesterase [Sphingobacterium faecium]